MNEAFDKSGDWPNVAVEAGSDPEEVMRRYGVEPRGLRTAAYEYERTIEKLRAQVSDLTLERDRLSRGLDAEQAIAATLGSEPDGIELTQTYDAGFRNGVMAVYQQLEGIEDYEELQCFIAEYWGEDEGNDER